MNSYLIGYDLNEPRGNRDYPELIKAIKSLGVWWHHLDSTWIVRTENTAAQVRDTLTPHVDSGDELLVVRLSDEGAWAGFNKAASDWLKQNL